MFLSARSLKNKCSLLGRENKSSSRPAFYGQMPSMAAPWLALPASFSEVVSTLHKLHLPLFSQRNVIALKIFSTSSLMVLERKEHPSLVS
jgi:hypothetical protein